MAVVPLPDRSHQETGAKPGRASQYCGTEHDPEKQPESPHEAIALELRAQVAPRERSGPEESHEKSAKSREILDGRAAQLVKL